MNELNDKDNESWKFQIFFPLRTSEHRTGTVTLSQTSLPQTVLAQLGDGETRNGLRQLSRSKEIDWQFLRWERIQIITIALWTPVSPVHCPQISHLHTLHFTKITLPNNSLFYNSRCWKIGIPFVFFIFHPSPGLPDRQSLLSSYCCARREYNFQSLANHLRTTSRSLNHLHQSLCIPSVFLKIKLKSLIPF